MLDNANRTTDFLKSIAHAGRLMILCRLAEGPATVSQLEKLLNMSQSSVSKQLARLREEELVDARRQGRSIYYSLADEKARRIVGTLYELFCDVPVAAPEKSSLPDGARGNEQAVRDD
ncbi:MAG TPA: transcriptional regulator [Devosia sp.]|nr:transcriptional regulator [Devosia sp.]